MAIQQSSFNRNAEHVAFDTEHRKRINYNIGRYDAAVLKGKQIFSNLELARQRAACVKYKSIYGLDKLLVEFETNFTRNGGKVIWAIDGEAALKAILHLFEHHKVDKVVKSKSMTSEEIELNEALEAVDVNVVETDLGEYIVQLAGEKPYHIVTPAMHKSKEDVAGLFNEKFGTDPAAPPHEITAFVRKKLKNEFREAQAGITGANFMLADIGAVAITENEGNGLLSMAFPDLHIVVAGIEKVMPSIDDLDLFWPLLATHGTGQALTAYNSIVSGPRKEGEQSGPKHMVVILIDNGRTKLLAKTRQRTALGCIRCGACLNVCPVYKNIGGHSYETTYSGPIGSVITPHMRGMKAYNHLSFASTLCGQCTEVCPVKIPLHELLILNRNDAVKEGFTSSSDRLMMKTSRKFMLNRSMMNLAGSSTKNLVIKYFVGNTWGNRREMPRFAPKTFGKLWKENENQIKLKARQKPPRKKQE